MRIGVPVLWILCAINVSGQSVSVASPSSNQTLSGFSGFSFAASITSGPTAYNVCYTVDAYPVPGPGRSCSRTPPYAVAWDTFWVLNGPHQVVATAFDALGNVIAASTPVAFTVSNTWPCPGAPSMTVTTGTPITSNWSGSVSVSGTLSGANAGSDKFQWNWFIDGVPGPSASDTSATHSQNLDTTQFADGPHVIGLVTQNQGTSCTTYSDGYEGAATEWTRTVTFSNGNTPTEVRESAHEVFLQPGGTYTLSPTLVNANQTTVSSPTFAYLSQNTSVARVGSSAGATCSVAAVGNGNAQILTMAETVTGTDLQVLVATGYTEAQSASHPFTYRNIGWMIHITGGTGFTPALYTITAVDNNHTAYLSSSPTGAAASGGRFALGPTRITWVFVAPANILPHFGTDGSILTAYNPTMSLFMNEGFDSTDGLTDQPYNTANTAGTNSMLGYGDDVNASGYNTLEFGITNQDMSKSSQTNFQNGQTSWINSYVAAVAPWPKFRFFATGDSLTQTSQIYYTTRGAGSKWSPPAVQYIFQSLKNAGSFIGVSWHDEINNNYGCCPLQGPIRFVSSPTAQSGLTSITSNGSTCTAHQTGWQYVANVIIIHGATTANFNSATGSTYTVTKVDNNAFTFPCSVSSSPGTYNSSTDPGLTIETLGAYGWTGSDYLHYDAWANLMNWASNVSGHTPVTGSNAAGTTLQSLANWSGNGTQSIGSVSQIGNWADLYWTHTTETYLPSRASSYALISDQNATIEEGNFTRSRYGSWNPALPITVLTQGTSTYYGFQGYPVGITSISNDVITFSAPHNLSTVIPCVTRLWISGTSNSAYNTNFYVNAILSPTSVSVSLAATDFSGTATGGTITFANGDAKGLSAATASTATVGSDLLTYSGSADNTVNRHIGQTFTVSGSAGTAAFNTRTFYMTAESVSLLGTSSFYYREMPTGSSTGGTVTMVADNNFVKGRNGSTDLAQGASNHPGYSFVSVIEAAILRAAGQRFYKFGDTTQGFLNQSVTLSNGVTAKAGWQGIFSQHDAITFQDNSRQKVGPGQLFSHPHWENGFAVPMFHAASIASLLISANQKYILQPALNSPDFGLPLDCAARAGSYGDIVMCLNGTEGSQTRTFNLSAYLQPGQQIIRYVADPQGITMTILAAGAPSDTVALNPDGAVFYVFPVLFSAELEQPTINVKLADVPHAATVAVRYHYDLYLLDKPTTNVFHCETGSCTLPVNRNIGTVYYQLIFLDARSQVLATSDVQTL
jgi:hypothetical protein